MLFTDNLKYDLVGIIISTLVIIVAYFKWCLGYWKRKGIETPSPSIPFGNTTDLFLARKTFGEVWRDIYFNLKSRGKRHGGAYFTIKPFYVPIDLDLVKNILQNDFQHFHSHGLFVNEDADPLSANLLSLDGARWKNLRAKLTPTFTSGKMKMMTQTLIECSYALKDILDRVNNNNESLDIRDVMGRFTTDIIETLRKYPPLPQLTRICTKEYNVPDTDLVIEKGMNVIIPIMAIHYDPEYYPDPDKFDPERFNEENKATRPPFSWLPFGEGPRVCIGLRFGLLQSKIGLVTLLKHYKVTLNKKTQVPIVFKKSGVILKPESVIWIDLHKINN